MEISAGKVAVVTGAASGIGLALARECADQQMHVVMADIADELDNVAGTMREAGHSVLPVRTDVSVAEDVQRLAEAATDRFGHVDLLCNNAGIAGLHRWTWNHGPADWRRILDINLNGVIHGMQSFLPAMIDRDAGHIVSTASAAGLVPTPMNAPYCASKYGIVGLSEVLSIDLQAKGSNVGVSVLCPGLVDTAIVKDFPEEVLRTLDAAERKYYDELHVAVRQIGIDPSEVAKKVLQAVRDNRFYILPHPETADSFEIRAKAILEGRSPSFPTQ